MPAVEKATEPMSGISSQETPLRGLEPNQVKCPDCGRTFKSHSEMERHRDTTHHEVLPIGKNQIEAGVDSIIYEAIMLVFIASKLRMKTI